MHIKEKQATGKKFDLVTCLRFSFEERTLNHRTGVKFALRDKRKSLLMTKIGSHCLLHTYEASKFPTNRYRKVRYMTSMHCKLDRNLSRYLYQKLIS